MSRSVSRLGLGNMASPEARPRKKPLKTSTEPLEPRLVMTAPTFATALPTSVNVTVGVPIHIALDGFDADNDNLTFSASVAAADAGKLQAIVPTGNRSIRFHISHTSSGAGDPAYTGTLTAELFEDLAPLTTSEIISRVQSNYYDGKIFHRIINNFVAQGGSANGLGNGGRGDEFDDEYHPDLRHSTAGVFSMAKAIDDGNDAQFFITFSPQPGLDFQHSVFGFQTEIDPSINFLVPRTGDKPNADIRIDDVELFTDHENGVLRLKALPGATGPVDVTITMSDGTTTVTHTLRVNIQAASTSTNTPPHFGDIDPIETNAGQAKTINLPIIDLEGHQFEINGERFSNDINVSFNRFTGQVTVTPAAGFVGVDLVRFYVSVPNAFVLGQGQTLQQRVMEIEPFVDRQLVTVLVNPSAPTIELLTDTGAADGVTNANNSAGRTLRFRVNNVTAGNKVDLRDSAGNLLATGTAAGTSIDFTVIDTRVFGDGPLTVTATQTFRDTLPGDASQVFDLESDPGSLTITIDTSNSPFDSDPVLEAFANFDYAYDAHTTGEGQPFSSYSLLTKPEGMSINAITGAITWKPTLAQANQNAVTIQFIDGVGNVSTQSFSINVLVPPILDFIPDKTAAENTILSFQPTASDANTGETLTFAFVGQPTGASIHPQSGTVTIISTESFGGSTVKLTILVRDSKGLTDTQEVSITWTEDNQVPVINDVAALSVIRGGQVTTNVTAFDPDNPARSLSLSIDPSNTTPGASITPGGQLTFNAGTLAEGQYNVVVRATEVGNNPLSTTKTIQVSVVANGPPVIQPIADQTVRQGETLVVNVQANDPDQLPLPLLYALAQGSPAGASIDSTGRLTFSPAGDFPLGELNITVIVTENGAGGESSQRTFKVTVQESANQPPTVPAIATQTVAQRKTLSLTVAASDPEGQRALTWALTGAVPAGAAINASTGLFTFSPAADFAVGPVTINVLVSEVGANPKSTPISFQVNVTANPNQAPTIGAIAPRSVVAGQSLSFGIPAADVDDPASPLTWSLTGNVPAGASINPATGLFTFNPSASFTPGPVTFRVQVTEAGANPLAATAQFTVEVLEPPPPNQAPVIGDVGQRAVSAGRTISFQVPATDPDNSAVLQFSLLDAELPGASIDPATGQFRFAPSAAARAGDYRFTVQAQEQGGGLAAVATFVVSVSQPLPGFDFFRFVGFELDDRGTTVAALNAPSTPTLPSFALPGGAPLPSVLQSSAGALQDGALAAGALPVNNQRLNLGANDSVQPIVDPNTLPGYQNEQSQGQPAVDKSAETPTDEGVVPATNEVPVEDPASESGDERSENQKPPADPTVPAAAAADELFDEVAAVGVSAPLWNQAPAQDAVGRWAERTFGIGEAVGRFDPDLLDLDLQIGGGAAPQLLVANRPLTGRTGLRESDLHGPTMGAEIAAAVRRLAEARAAERAAIDEALLDDEADEDPGALTTAPAAALGFYMPLLVTDIAEPAKPRRKGRPGRKAHQH